tara:strand:+ start:10214 stop:10594 length:381 start_codon:yes stop_codon:yes gene_type:complete
MNDQNRFSGDMDRNEVEMDLNKFMAMIQEISDLKDKIRDLESDSKVNPHQKWIHLARAVDSWRIFPRVFLSVYIFLLYYSTMWFMALEDPSLEQSGLISIIVGAGAAWFGLYAGTSNSSKGFKGED